MHLRPSITETQDLLYWKLSKTGSYTVKLGYYVQRQLNAEVAQPNQVLLSSSPQLRNTFMHKLWMLNIPPKLKIFWWKLLHNGLLVATILVRRGCIVNPEC